MIRKCWVVGDSVHDVYDWLSANYPLENINGVDGFVRAYDWSIAYYSLKATIDFVFPRNQPVTQAVLVILTNEQQLALFKLRFCNVILREYK
jgi:hypothetical protein